jgi:hypothetical protein
VTTPEGTRSLRDAILRVVVVVDSCYCICYLCEYNKEGGRGRGRINRIRTLYQGAGAKLRTGCWLWVCVCVCGEDLVFSQRSKDTGCSYQLLRVRGS